MKPQSSQRTRMHTKANPAVLCDPRIALLSCLGLAGMLSEQKVLLRFWHWNIPRQQKLPCWITGCLIVGRIIGTARCHIWCYSDSLLDTRVNYHTLKVVYCYIMALRWHSDWFSSTVRNMELHQHQLYRHWLRRHAGRFRSRNLSEALEVQIWIKECC